MQQNNTYTIATILKKMVGAFNSINMEQSEAEAVAIIAELLECSRGTVLFDRHKTVSAAIAAEAEKITCRRLQNEPWQYIFNRAYFRDLELYVDKNVLIPRPETELLVDWVIEHLPPHGSVLDLGTGSGAIAISTATERRDSQVTACDISKSALEIARRNSSNAGAENIEFVQSDLFTALTERKFDIIAANLPYVTEKEYSGLSPEVKDFEPKLALTSGDDGLDLIRKAIACAPAHLTTHGTMILEMSDWQTTEAAEIFADAMCWCAIEIIRDYTGRNRFVAARKRGEQR